MAQTSTAIYCRLSQDDGQVGESGSIQTQKTLLAQYCSDHHFSVFDTYCDDGWSGTNFDRPQFQRMMEDIEAGKINTVMVKDLSRFGREYAQMGLYIEHYSSRKVCGSLPWVRTLTPRDVCRGYRLCAHDKNPRKSHGNSAVSVALSRAIIKNFIYL